MDKAGSKLSRLAGRPVGIDRSLVLEDGGVFCRTFFFAENIVGINSTSMFEVVPWAIAGYNSSSHAYPGRGNRVGARHVPLYPYVLVHDTFCLL